MIRWRNILPLIVACASILCQSVSLAQEGDHFRNSPSARKFAVILVGASINESYADTFGTWGLGLRNTLIQDYGYDKNNITLLIGNESENSFNVEGACTAESIRSVFAKLSNRIEGGDQLLLVMIGHGTGQGETAKFNIVGPDLTAMEFSTLLDTINTQDLVLVNTTSAGHDFVKTQSKFGRILVSATRSRAEKYDTVFAKYFVEGLRDHKADRDKNKRVSVLEIFNYAKAQVAEHYKSRGSLPSEHPALDDNGDGLLVTEPGAQGDGSLAEIAYFDVSLNVNTGLSQQAAILKTRMDNLERDVFLLRNAKSSYKESEYWEKMEKLLVQLAITTRDFNAIAITQ